MRKGRNIGCVLAADTSERRPLDARTVTAPLMRLLLSQFQGPPAPRRPFRFFRFGCPSGYAAGLIAQPTSDRPTWEARSVTDSSTTADDTECGMTTLRTASSMEFLCSFCGKRRGDAKDWLLGFEGTKEKSVVMKYTITLLGKWDEERASEPNAVHFCSTACQNNYVYKNYGDDTWAA